MARKSALLMVIMLLTALLPGCGGGDGGSGGSSPLSWTFVDGNNAYLGLSAGSHVRMTEFNSRLYATYTEGNHIRVKVYGGNDAAPVWTSVAGAAGGIEKETVYGTAGYSSFIAFNGKLYAVWTEGFDDHSGTTRPDCVRVAVYNGNDSTPVWTFVDGGGDTTAMIGSSSVRGPSLAVVGSKLYVAWGANGGGVAVYNGDDTNPAWTSVDAGAMSGQQPQLAALGSTLYLAFPSPLAYGIMVKAYNGNDSAPAWTSVPGPLGDRGTGEISRVSGAECDHPSLAVFDGRLYLSWAEKLNLYLPDTVLSMQIHVAVYNGNDASPDWSFMDGGSSFGINKDVMSYSLYGSWLRVANGKLYASWSEDYPLTGVGQVRAAVFSGNPASPSWAFVDGNKAMGLNKDTAVPATDPYLTGFGGRLYAGWNENGQVRIAVGK